MSAVLESEKYFVRPMGEFDLDDIMAIEIEAYSFPWTKKIFSDCIRVGYCCQLVKNDRDIVAYAIMSMGAGEAHLLNLCVRSEMQGHGVGNFTLNAMLEKARENLINSVFLEVRPSNDAAVALYQNYGFNEVGRRKNYYPALQGREDAVIFALELNGITPGE